MRLFFRYNFFAALLVMMILQPLSSAMAHSDSEFDAEYYPTILQFDGEDELRDLESAGVVVWHSRENMALALIPLDSADSVKTMSKIRKKGGSPRLAPRRAHPCMDIAKTHFNAAGIVNSQAVGTPYTGKGVVVGLCDIGLDPNHINFLDKDGKSRVKRVVYLNELHNERIALESAEAIHHWRSDDETQYHGTHVAGIMAGSYADNGFSGMAPGADIVMTSCKLYDVGILAACEEIIDYAKSVGKPAVINLSLGSYNGPHDGSTLFNRYLDLLGREAIICMASGNNGDARSSIKLDFTQDDTRWMGRLFNSSWDQMQMYGMTDVWSSDDSPISFRYHIYDDIDNALVYSSPVIDDSTEMPYETSHETDAEFAKYLTGSLSVYTDISELNGRRYLEFVYDTQAHAYHSAEEKWARYSLVIEVIGEPGQKMDVTSDGQYSWFSRWRDYRQADDALSVSDIATGDNLICVGMYNNRSEMPRLNGTVKDFGVQPLTINVNSGFGTLRDGRVLPHTVAPGAYVVSSISTDYTENFPDKTSTMTARVSHNGKDYYWYYNIGTSMSTPYVAGVVATWLEAVPSLDVDDIKQIILESNATDCYDFSDGRNGQGWLRPVEGLVKAMGLSSVAQGSIDNSETAIMIKGDSAEIYNPGYSNLSISLVALDGAVIFRDVIVDDTFRAIDLSDLSKGLYILTVTDGRNAPVVKKFMRK